MRSENQASAQRMLKMTASRHRSLSDSGIQYTQSQCTSAIEDTCHEASGNEPVRLMVPELMLKQILQTIEAERRRANRAELRDASQKNLEGMLHGLEAELQRYEAELRHWDKILQQTEDQYVRARCADLDFHISDLQDAIEDVKGCERKEHKHMEEVHVEQDIETSKMAEALDRLLVAHGFAEARLGSQREQQALSQPFPLQLFDGPRYSLLRKLEHGSEASDMKVERTHTRPELWPERSWGPSETGSQRAARLISEARDKLDGLEQCRPRGTSIYYEEDMKAAGLWNDEPPRSPTNEQILAWFDRDQVHNWLPAVATGKPGVPSLHDHDEWSSREIELGEDEDMAANYYRLFFARGEDRDRIDRWKQQCRQNSPKEYEEAKRTLVNVILSWLLDTFIASHLFRWVCSTL